MRLFKIISLFMIVLVLVCCKKKSTKPDDGLPHYNTRYTDIQPAWSADGKTIAYVHGGTGDEYGDTTGIYLIDIDGTNRRLFYKGIRAYSPDYSPDGNWLVFSDNAQIFKIKLNGDSLTQLTFGGRNFYPDWSPDGERIAYDRSTNEPDTSADSSSSGIWIMNADGTNKKHIIGGAFTDWSPDGSKLVYVGLGSQIYIADTTGTNQTQITFLKDYDNRYPVFSPDGQKIAFSTAHYSAPVIYVMDSDGKNLKMLTPEGGDEPAWSPDGKYIAYNYVHPDYGRIFIMDADGSNKRQLTFDGW